jgi:hypothetical protein
MTRWLAIIATVLAVAPVRAQPADADDVVPLRPMEFAEIPPDMAISGAFTDVFDADLLARLSSGFATNVVAKVYVYRDGLDLPVWFSVGTWRVVYDLWDEVYEVRIRDAHGERTLREKTRADALRDVTSMSEMPIAPLESIEVGPRYFAGIVVEVNPVSPELLAEVRRWMARPQGKVAGDASFFGSFVSIFVNPKVPEADRVLRFRTQLFYRKAAP